jgi:NtrC-family two-component system sensor histidine kinase KinB
MSQWMTLLYVLLVLAGAAALFCLASYIAYMVGHRTTPSVQAWQPFGRWWLAGALPSVRDAVLESMSDGVCVLDEQGQITDLNPAVEQILGEPASSLIGQSIEAVLSNRSRITERHHELAEIQTPDVLWAEMIVDTEPHKQGRPETPVQDALPQVRGDGWRHFELRVSPLREQASRRARRLVILHDITERKQVEEALRTQKQLFEDLVAVARATAERPTLEATLQSALTVAAELTSAEYGTLFLLDHEGVVTDSLLVRGREPLLQQREVIERIMDKGLAGWVAQHQQAALIWDTTQDERWLHVTGMPSTSTRSVLAVPIVSGSALLGILTLTHSEVGHFSDENLRLMQAAADHMALALHNARMFDMQRRMADRQTTLYEVLRVVAAQLAPGAVVQSAVESIGRFAGWPDVAIALPSEDRVRWTIYAAHGSLWEEGERSFDIDRGIIGRAFRTARTQLAADVGKDPDYLELSPSIQSELAVPLRRGERTLGVLDVQSDMPAAFDTHEVLLAELLAETIALALDNARLYAETQQHVSDLDALYTVTRMTGQSLALEDVLTRALASVLLSLGFQAGLISLVDVSSGRLRLVAEHGLPSALSRRLQEDGLEGMLCGHVHEQRGTLAISDLRADVPEPLRETTEEVAALGLRAYAGIPLLLHESSLGTMGLFSHRPRSFTVSEMTLLEAIGRQVATAVTNARLFQATVNERQRLLTLIESSRDGIVLVGLDKQVLVINAPALRLLYLPGEPADWTDRTIHDALDLLQGHASSAAETIRTEMDRIQVGDEPPDEVDLDVPPRAIRWLDLPVSADQGPLGRLFVFRDVTEERMLAKMRDDLTHTLVHDLRNPLTGISVALQLLDSKLAQVISPAQHRLFEIADTSVQKMVDLVNAILDVSRLERGRMPLNPHTISLVELIAEVLRLQSPLLTARNLTLESDVPWALPLVRADPELIGRVLQNLVGNAIKFTPDGGHIKVTAREGNEKTPAGEAGVRCLFISIKDDGPGISPELQSRLFEKFVVGEQKERGSGLGLAFCKLAVEAHGGRIWVDSAPENGTKMAFTLPIAPPGDPADTAPHGM